MTHQSDGRPYQYRLATMLVVAVCMAIVFALARVAAPDAFGRISFSLAVVSAVVVTAVILVLAYKEGLRYETDVTRGRVESLAKQLGYPVEAIQFVQSALPENRGTATHEVGAVLRRRAVEAFGEQARAILEAWGLERSEDFGRIIDGLVRKQLLMAESGDNWNDFVGTFDLDDLFRDGEETEQIDNT